MVDVRPLTDKPDLEPPERDPTERSDQHRHTLAPTSMLVARTEQVVLAILIVAPLTAVAAAVPLLWGGLISWRDTLIAAVMYAVTGHGITIGFHRYFTHRGFRASRPVRVALAVAGSMAVQGPVIGWVADHRRHHAFSDSDGDPHSPWRYGGTPRALAKGMWHAHIGWMFDAERTDQRHYAPDLLGDPDIARVDRAFGRFALLGLALPTLVGGLWGGSLAAAASAFLWGGLARMALFHHVTWATNSICHVVGSRPYRSRDRSTNVWPLAPLSLGENWHNLHHAEPTLARHGVESWQLDTSAYLIKLMETLRLVRDVRWPDRERLAAKIATADGAGPA